MGGGWGRVGGEHSCIRVQHYCYEPRYCAMLWLTSLLMWFKKNGCVMVVLISWFKPALYDVCNCLSNLVECHNRDVS